MKAGTTIRKVMFIAVWLCIGGGMITLLLAAISKKNSDRCSDYSITIKGAGGNYFIDKKDVEELLRDATKGNIKGAEVSSFNLHELERMLESNTWIDEAELYFDNREVLHVTVSEKEPVARIFTTTGSSFYIDSLGRAIPLSDKLSARVPVFTGFPGRKKLSSADSLLLNDVRVTANYIVNDPFWLSQVAQIDITEQRKMEMIPVVGNHLVRLGDGENIDKKFHRLMVFYKEVLSKTGFDRYKVIDVQFKGQVVASRYAGNAKVDSIQLKKNVEKLLRQSMESENDTAIRVMPQFVKLEADSSSAPDPALQENSSNPPSISNPVPLKSSSPKTMDKKTSQPVKNETLKPVKNENPKPVKSDKPVADKSRTPKAVMPKKPVAEEDRGYN